MAKPRRTRCCRKVSQGRNHVKFEARLARVAILGVVFPAVTVWAVSSAHAAAWTGVKTLEPIFGISSPPEAPVVAVNASGRAIAVWGSPVRGVLFSERMTPGAWSPAKKVLRNAVGDFPQVALGTDGTTAVSWIVPGTEFVPRKLVITVRPAGGAWPAATELATGTSLLDSKLAVAADGTVTIVWVDGGGVKTRTLPPAGTWSPALVLSPGGVGVSLPDLVVNDAGAGLAVWQAWPPAGSAPAYIGAAYRPAGGAWEAPQVVSTGTGQATWNPKPGLDAAGDAAIGYLDGNTMLVALKPADAAWGLPVPVSPATQSVYHPALAMDAAGNIVVAWQALGGSNQGSISTRTFFAAGNLSGVTQLSRNAEDANWPTAAINSDGSIAVVTWVDNQTLRARASVGSVTGTWTTTAIGAAWWGTTVPVGAGGGVGAAAWAAPGLTANQAKIVANAYN